MRSARSSRVTVLTTAQAAAVLGVHERTLRRYLSMGLLGHRRLPGGHYRIPVEALAEFWEANEKPAVMPSSERRLRADAPGRGSSTAPPPGDPSRRRGLYGEGRTGVSYDLSTEALSALRSQLS